MAANIELKYFNTFWLKKIKSITKVLPGAEESPGVPFELVTLTGAGIEVQNTATLTDGFVNV